MSEHDVWNAVTALRERGSDGVVITITGVRGSVPGSVGGKALIDLGGLISGNLGGGKIEARAVREALDLLGDGASGDLRQYTWNLQQDIGMTCGGEVSMLFERIRAHSPWHLLIFGAGHIGQALAPILATLPARIDIVDTREEWLRQLPASPKLTPHLLPSFEAGADLAGPNTSVVCVTKGHATDRPVVRDILRAHPEIPFIGAIGSASKRATLIAELRSDGIPDAVLDRLHCPLGLPLGTNDPAEIAISITAQLIKTRDDGAHARALPPV